MRMLLLAAAVTMLTGPLTAYGAPAVIQLSPIRRGRPPSI